MFLKIAPTVVSPVYIFQLQWMRDYIALHIHAEDSSGMSEIYSGMEEAGTGEVFKF